MQMFCIQNVNWSKCYLWNMSLLVQNMKTIQYCLWLSVLRLLCSHLYTCKKTIWSYIEYMVYGISQIHVIKMCIYTLCDFIDSVACFFGNKIRLLYMKCSFIMLWICHEFLANFLCSSYAFPMISYEFLMKFLWNSSKFLMQFLCSFYVVFKISNRIRTA
jgi:hypothetical protein